MSCYTYIQGMTTEGAHEELVKLSNEKDLGVRILYQVGSLNYADPKCALRAHYAANSDKLTEFYEIIDVGRINYLGLFPTIDDALRSMNYAHTVGFILTRKEVETLSDNLDKLLAETPDKM